jgi:sugar lactone lactonase YvrE
MRTAPLVALLFLALAVSISAADPTVTFLSKWTAPSAWDVAPAPDGTVLVSDLDHVSRFTAAGALMEQWYLPPVGINPHGQPGWFTIDDQGFAYFTAGFGYVQKVTLDGALIAQWRLQQTSPGISPQAFGIAVGSDGNIFAADSRNRVIQKFTPNGGFLLRWFPNGAPEEVAADRSGHIYAASYTGSAYQIQVFDLNGNHLFDWGGAGSGDGQFQNINDVGVDASGNVYVSDGNLQRVQEFAPDGTFLAVIGGPGTGDGQFQGPLGIGTDTIGNVFVADSPRIQKFGPAPVATEALTWGKLKAAYRGPADRAQP